MIRDHLFFAFFYLILILAHWLVYNLFPGLYFGDEIILSYAVLIILSFTGNSLFRLTKRFKEIQFAQLFMIFTTVQLLGAMVFAAYIRYAKPEYAKEVLLQFVILFFVVLLFQSIYFVKRKAGR
ncbi:MAG: hypothetical protein R3277_10935 [Brumimicrobium sp.]|nr:hypothetical protein [Brumimicrobium sp.]